MGIRTISTLILSLYYLVCAAQSPCDVKYDYIWLFGGSEDDTVTTDKYGGSELNFNYTPPIAKSHPKGAAMLTQTASMCNREGELIFYSNGCDIFNRFDTIMEGGDGLSPGEVADLMCRYNGYVGGQSMLSIPDSYNDSVYYLIYTSLQFNPNMQSINAVISENIYYSTINIKEHDGVGRVTAKNQIILSDTNLINTPLSAVKHANGKDWWLITPNRWDNGIHKILLDSLGFHYLGTQYIGIAPHVWAETGQGKFSPNGSRFGWFHPYNGLFLYQFDRTSGVLSDFLHIEIPCSDFGTGGCEFSPSGRFLYVCNDSSLFQIDVEALDIQQSVTHIAEFDGFVDGYPTRFFLMERAPNGKILMSSVNSTQYLHVINAPDKKGVACNFTQHSLMLPTHNVFTMPHFPNYRLGALGDEPCEDMSVGIDEIDQDSLYCTVIPNPASSTFEIQSTSEISGMEMLTMDGRIVSPQIIHYGNLVKADVSSLPNGIYVCRVLFKNKQVQTVRVSVIH